MQNRTIRLIIIIAAAVLVVLAGILVGMHLLRKRVDIIIFMGQSNMAGRGITDSRWPEEAPAVTEGAGWEFRAVSDPSRLYPLEEPFGLNENSPGRIDDGQKKTGSLVSSFINAYYAGNGKVPVVAVSASKGGTEIARWSGQGIFLADALERLQAARTFVGQSEYAVRHVYAVWCQGESDADYHTKKSDYEAAFEDMVGQLKNAGVEKVFMISIGRLNDPGQWDLYDDMIAWQAELADRMPDVVLVADDFKTMRDRGLMKDAFHYYQQGYNECGAIAGQNAALYVTRGKTGPLSFSDQ